MIVFLCLYQRCRRENNVIVHFILVDTLTDKVYFYFLQKLEPATPKWKTIVLALGFQYDQLNVIERKPMLIPEGDSDYICDIMLNQWLKWAPPNHEWPTVSKKTLPLTSEQSSYRGKVFVYTMYGSFSLMCCGLTP